MGNPDKPLRSVDNLMNAVRAVGMVGGNYLMTLEDFNGLIDEYDAYSEEVRSELKRVCEALSEDFHGLKVIGTFKLMVQLGRTCKFTSGQPQFHALYQLLEAICERPVVMPGEDC